MKALRSLLKRMITVCMICVYDHLFFEFVLSLRVSHHILTARQLLTSLLPMAVYWTLFLPEYICVMLYECWEMVKSFWLFLHTAVYWTLFYPEYTCVMCYECKEMVTSFWLFLHS